MKTKMIKCSQTGNNLKEIKLFRHQAQLLQAIDLFLDISYFFLIGGYGCGKSFLIVMLILWIVKKYEKSRIFVGIGGNTITLIRKTILVDLFRILNIYGIPYTEDKQENTITIGNITFVLIAIHQPSEIYAYNFSVFICDEIDEQPQEKAIDGFKAIQERTRIVLPDGRKPYTVFCTTAQGFRGTYQITRELKEKNEQYVLIRGKTKDNILLTKDYVDKLYSLYDDNERLAYLEGYFVNLRAGRVYPEFNEDTMTVPYFDIEDYETIMIGQDLNAGFSKGCCIVKRNKILYVHKIFSFVQIGAAPTIIRNNYSGNPVYWYPDSAGQGREVMSGYTTEIRNANIQLRMANINPSIIDRVFFVNKLFKTGRLKLCKGCESLAIALKTRAYNDLGMPEKGKGENAPDHWCLVGETKILTNKGEKEIKDIKINDYVLTRKGFKKVINSKYTGEKMVYEYNILGNNLISTKEHKIITKLCKKTVDTLTQSDICYIISKWKIKTANKLFSMILFLEGILNRIEENCEYISPHLRVIEEKEYKDYIKKYGNQKMGRYQKAMWFIIKTIILLIIKFQILSLKKIKNIVHIILKNFIKSIQKLSLLILIKPELRQLNGIKVQKVENGIRNTLKILILEFRRKLILFVNNVVNYINQTRDLFFVLINVNQNIDEIQEKIMKKDYVLDVEKNSTQINIQRQLHALNHVEENIIGKPKGKRKVYNLTIGDEHEYYANNILVSNCDSLEYVIFRIIMSDPDFFDLKRVKSQEG